MRNTTYRKTLDSIASLINDAIGVGIEPLALAVALRQMADQCDKLAQTFEQQEQKESEKDDEQDV